ncbi:hypothetical protein [Virgibacillus doumboii]|uniref:hypothetical protein n=1 Tax=Virgibacillus doumboii TaxID=2697503 RepID=UPI0013E085BC|nr:hypothetical protein [Virgibacillus doumboii]
MLFLVENCFHWIGFHVVDFLLENGHRVDGMDDMSTDKKEHLSMFVGRNELFTHVTETERETAYDTTITIRKDDELVLTLNNGSTTKINFPLVYGKWMPMEPEGMYYNNQFIRFNSDHFLSEAVYIEDVLQSLIQWVKSSNLSPVLEVKSIHEKHRENKKLENSIFIRNNRPIKENVNIVINHYETYKNFY